MAGFFWFGGAGEGLLQAGAGSQNLTPSLFTNSQTFYGPTVSTGAVTLTPSLVTNSQTFYAPTVAVGAVTLTPALVTNSQTFYAPTITVGGVALTAGLFTNSQTFYGPTVAPGAVTLTPDLYTNAQVFYGPTVTAEGAEQELTPDLFTNDQTFFEATVSPGAVTLTIDLAANDNTFYGPVVTVGAAPGAAADEPARGGWLSSSAIKRIRKRLRELQAAEDRQDEDKRAARERLEETIAAAYRKAMGIEDAPTPAVALVAAREAVAEILPAAASWHTERQALAAIGRVLELSEARMRQFMRQMDDDDEDDVMLLLMAA